MNLIEMYSICSFELVEIGSIMNYNYPKLHARQDVRVLYDYLINTSDSNKLTYSLIRDHG